MTKVTEFVIDKSLAALNAEGQHYRSVVELWVKESFGERCLGYEENCACCQRWKAFDELFAEL